MCSDVTGEMAAALAHAAVAFKDVPALRKAYWRKAQWAYLQTGAATGKFGNSNDAYELLRTYYPSSGVVSHVFFAAASMYTACKALKCPDEATYLADANRLGVTKEADGGQKWFWEIPGWDNAWWDGAILMTRAGQPGPAMFGKPAFTQFLESFADKWTNGKAPIQYASVQSACYVQDQA
jgi:Glycosyl hydrolase family 9